MEGPHLRIVEVSHLRGSLFTDLPVPLRADHNFNQEGSEG